MKKSWIILLVLLTGCTASQQKGCRSWQSSTFGLKRTVTLYDANGGVIKEWETETDMGDQGGTIDFLDGSGRLVTISGTFIIEEKP